MSGVKAIYVGQIVYTTYVAMCIVYICTLFFKSMDYKYDIHG